MPILSNAKHELFAQALADGKTQVEAQGAAGYRAHRGNASSLAQDKSIVARVAEILAQREHIQAQGIAKAIEKTGINRAWVIERLVENVDRAMQAEPVIRDGEATGEYQYAGAVANKALELLGKELGMFVERHEHRVGELNEKSDDELDSIIRRSATEAKISFGVAGEGSETQH